MLRKYCVEDNMHQENCFGDGYASQFEVLARCCDIEREIRQILIMEEIVVMEGEISVDMTCYVVANKTTFASNLEEVSKLFIVFEN